MQHGDDFDKLVNTYLHAYVNATKMKNNEDSQMNMQARDSGNIPNRKAQNAPMNHKQIDKAPPMKKI